MRKQPHLRLRWVSCLLLSIRSAGNETRPVRARERVARLGRRFNTSSNSSCSSRLPSSCSLVSEEKRGGKAAARPFTIWFLSRARVARCGAAQKVHGSMLESWLSPRWSSFNLRRFKRVGNEVNWLPCEVDDDQEFVNLIK